VTDQSIDSIAETAYHISPEDDDLQRIYVYALEQVSPPSTERARLATELDHSAFEKAVARLVSLRLVNTDRLAAGELVPVAPDSARLSLLMPITRSLEQHQRKVDVIREIYAKLTLLYQESAVQRNLGVSVVTEASDIQDLIAQLSSACTNEMLASRPGGIGSRTVLVGPLENPGSLVDRGVQIRALYQHAGRYDSATVAQVARLANLGVSVRTTCDEHVRALIFDRDAVVLERQAPLRGAVLIRDCSVVHALRESFDHVWSEAITFGLEYDQATIRRLSEDVKTMIVRLLIKGLDDKIIARRLGISLRTCQRHIYEIMNRLGARSRLQAGYMIRQHGYDRADHAAPSNEASPQPSKARR
jgi:hypothetical protein